MPPTLPTSPTAPRVAIPVLSIDGDTPPIGIAPTDVSQFIRLDQCERYLRLRLHERTEGQHFLRDYDVAPQSIPPLLTRSGSTFEETVEAGIASTFPLARFSPADREAAGRDNDNDSLIAATGALAPGEVRVLAQPRLGARLGAWLLRGDVDLIRLERRLDGALAILIADIKSSTAGKVEHRLQVAFYHEMLAAILDEAGLRHDPIALGILYRGPAAPDDPAKAHAAQTVDETATNRATRRAADLERQREAAQRLLGSTVGFLEEVADPDAYIGAVHDLVLGERSTARRVLATDFERVPFHLTYKCDGCLYNEFCMKQSAESDNLSLLPHLTDQDKSVLQREGITTVTELATLKDLRRKGTISIDGVVQEQTDLVPAPGQDALSRRLAATWPVGPRVDELVHRARRYRKWKGDPLDALSWIPNAGYGSLPYSDAEQNPNLVRLFVDVQHDYLTDRVYMLGALVIGNERGQPHPKRRRSVVRLARHVPESTEEERELLVDWVTETLRAVVEVAAPDADGQPRAPIHLVFINAFAQRVLLDALGRHATTILGATALYDFVTQLAAFDSPLSTFLDRQIRERKNYPMVCQSLQSVAAYLRFDWNAGTPYRDIFRERLFDYLGKLDRDRPDGGDWFTRRARFNSQIPLEYAYAAWDQLTPPPERGRDDLAPYRAVTPDLLAGFHARRLEAMEHVTGDLAGNRQTTQTPFVLPDLASFEQKATTFADALEEFVTIERHVELAAWKSVRLAAPEQRVLGGETLIVRYLEEDQAPGITERNRDNERRRQLNEAYRAEFREANPAAGKIALTKAQKDETQWSQDDMTFRLRIDVTDVDCDLDEALALSTFKVDDYLVIYPRWAVDSRLPEAERMPYTPTAKQLLYGMRVVLVRIVVERDEGGRAVRAFAEVRPRISEYTDGRGFLFGGRQRPLEGGETYTLDIDPNNIYAYWMSKVTAGLVASGQNTLHALFTAAPGELAASPWSEVSQAAQERFLAGLDALRDASAFHDLEASKRQYIGGHGTTPLLLVQGPPGTGKSYATAFAVLARIQGAMAADQDFRVALSCKTHAATDVLLENITDVRRMLEGWAASHPAIFEHHFDRRLLDVPLYRNRPRGDVPGDVTAIPHDRDRPKGTPRAADVIAGERWTVIATTPGGTYGMVKDRWPSALFGRGLVHCLVLDEASQMSIPEAAMAALPLAADGTLIVVGDHRQMPPIVHNDWEGEPRRTFQEFRSYESLFLALQALHPPMIRFEESFRLHAAMAEFLRREIYHMDEIAYRSSRHDLIEEQAIADPFVASVLARRHPLTVVVHDEAASQLRNRFEQDLIAPLLAVLAAEDGYALDPDEGLGVVVPHRAQRAALQEELPGLARIDPDTGAVTHSAVDTVERFQGGERTVILISATESDRAYLQAAGKFLMNPQRLTVALSRAKRKLVLVAARSVFEVFSADEETFANAQLWKNLLRRTCTVPLWTGERNGIPVAVWGNPSDTPPPNRSHSPNGSHPS